MKQFDYKIAFSRNLGWVTPEEQIFLKGSCVGIAGLGGVGGYYAEALARLGIGNFVLSDFDTVDLPNFNRQACALMETLGQRKDEVISQKILSINPKAKIKLYGQGLKKEDLKEFVESIDVYVDGLDFFVLDLRIDLFAELRRQGKPAIIVAPLGMGASLVTFDQKSMSFEDHFGLSKAKTPEDKALQFLLGLAPSLMQRKGLVYPAAVDLKAHKVPSMPMGVFLCAGVAATEVLKCLTARGPRHRAPWVQHFDAYQNKYKRSYILWGYKSPLQKLKLWIAKMILKKE